MSTRQSAGCLASGPPISSQNHLGSARTNQHSNKYVTTSYGCGTMTKFARFRIATPHLILGPTCLSSLTSLLDNDTIRKKHVPKSSRYGQEKSGSYCKTKDTW